eukprot:XP_028343842.1 transmembrane protein-like [Physeter catodon]
MRPRTSLWLKGKGEGNKTGRPVRCDTFSALPRVLQASPRRGPLPSPRSETNSSTGDLGVGAGGRSPWDDPAGFIVVPAAYALAPGLGLPANVATLAVFVHRGRRLGQALHFHLLDLALADVLFTLTLLLWLTYYLGPTHWPFPEAACRAAGATYCVSTFAALTSVCRCGSDWILSPAASLNLDSCLHFNSLEGG